MNISKRFSIYDEEYDLIPIKVGMVIAEKIDEDGVYLEPRTFPCYDFSYVVFKVLDKKVEVRDTGHNNIWTLDQDELKGYELVQEWHPNGQDQVISYVNEALTE